MPFLGGVGIQIIVNIFRAVFKRQRFQQIIEAVLKKQSFDLAIFLGTFGGVFKVNL